MFAWLRRKLVVHRLRPVVTVLPAALKNGFGRRRHYMLFQVKQALERKGVAISLLPVAAAAFCSYEEFRRLDSKLTLDDYLALREMLAGHFGLETDRLSTEHLLTRRIS